MRCRGKYSKLGTAQHSITQGFYGPSNDRLFDARQLLIPVQMTSGNMKENRGHSKAELVMTFGRLFYNGKKKVMER